MTKYFSIAILFLMALVGQSCHKTARVREACSGVLDLTDWDPRSGEMVKLDGEWRLFWDQFLMPGDSVANPMLLIDVPLSWSHLLTSHGSLPYFGRATYQLTVKVNPKLVAKPGEACVLGLKIRDIHSAYRIFLNGRHYLDKGDVSEKPQYRPVLGHEVIYFEADTSDIVITIHVANYSDPRQSGMDESIILGPARGIEKNLLASNYLYTVSFGILFVLFVYHLLLYLFRRSEKVNLDFAVMCLLLSIQSLFIGQKAIYSLFPDMNAGLYIRIFMASVFVIGIAFRYYGRMLLNEFPAKLVKAVVWFYSVMTVYFLVQPFNINLIGVIYLVITILMLVYALVALIIAVVNKRPFAVVIFIGTSFVIFAGINDLLHALEIIYTGYFAPLGFIAYTFSQSALISYKFSKSFGKTEKLSNELESLNQNLEELVRKRTYDLDQANKDLILLNATKDRFFSIIAHDLRGPIGAVSSLLEIIISESADFPEEQRKILLQQTHNSAENTYNLLENLLTWARSQQGEISYEPGGCRVAGIIGQVEHLLVESAKKKGINLTSEINADYLVYCDANMIQTVLRNLVSNAIKFTGRDGKIVISTALDQERNVVISVSDTGTGIPQKLMDSLFKIDKKFASIYGTDGEKGTGLGLIISSEFLDKHGSRFVVTSKENEGATFSFALARIEGKI